MLHYSEYDKLKINDVYNKLVDVDCIDRTNSSSYMDHEVSRYLAGKLKKHKENVFELGGRLFWSSKRKRVKSSDKDIYFRPVLYAIATKIYLRKIGCEVVDKVNM